MKLETKSSTFPYSKKGKLKYRYCNNFEEFMKFSRTDLELLKDKVSNMNKQIDNYLESYDSEDDNMILNMQLDYPFDKLEEYLKKSIMFLERYGEIKEN